MRRSILITLGFTAVLAMVMIPLVVAQQQGGQPAASAQPTAAPARGAQPAPAAPARAGGRGVVAVPQTNDDPLPKIPVGFTSIFNGKDLTGWHISKTNHHGTTPDFRVLHGVLVGTQQPFLQGGILLTDKKYKNVEVYMEIKPDWGCDSGLFLRSDASGGAYQVMLDYLPGGTMVAGIYGERLQGVNMNGPGWDALSAEQRQAIQAKRTEAWQKAWKREEWNSVRARIEGNPPRITTWLNDEIMFQGTDVANNATGGAEDGHIGIQVHNMNRWRPGAFWRWRVIAVKELP